MFNTKIMTGKIVSVNISLEKGSSKTPVDVAFLKADFGIVGDAHASSKWHRQVSLLDIESILKVKISGIKIKPGMFAENLTTKDIDLSVLTIGTRVLIGDRVVLEVAQIGKECHTRCEIYKSIGNCIMPIRGVFARVIKGSIVYPGESIRVIF